MIVIIAHRLSTIEHCDRIYQLDRGRILKFGSYHEVVLRSLTNLLKWAFNALATRNSRFGDDCLQE
jgi:ABC-type bacteriocin/lantibiotic exporter with double-glycine peptidase domain